MSERQCKGGEGVAPFVLSRWRKSYRADNKEQPMVVAPDTSKPWPAPEPANLLTYKALDPYGKIPEFKYCAVKLIRGGQVPSAELHEAAAGGV